MTARRRRKSGSGPSATALIAWVGGARIGTESTADVSLTNDRASSANLTSYPRSLLTARGRGLAAGTLLACGSMLAVAVHAADSSLTPGSAPLPGLATAGPHAGSAGYSVGAPFAVVEGWAAAASARSGQALAGTYVPSGGVRRHVPLALRAPGSPPSEATLPLSMNLPGTGEAQAPDDVLADRMVVPVAQVPEDSVAESLAARVTPVLASFTQQSGPGEDDPVEPGEQGPAPAEEGTQPAMTMLSPLLLA